MPTQPAARRGGFSLPDPIRARIPGTDEIIQIVYYAQMIAAVRDATKAERRRCAEICESAGDGELTRALAKRIAEQIRKDQ